LDMLSYYGLSEIEGGQHNPLIVAFFHDIGFDWVKDDETAWCSACINYFAQKYEYERSGSLMARSWLNVGEIITEPQLGDVVVFWRGSQYSALGHCGLYINKNETYIWTFGGNQANSLNIAPYSKGRLLGYRRLRKIEDL
jgi:uncharacterized protein (TIGR02594 family)